VTRREVNVNIKKNNYSHLRSLILIHNQLRLKKKRYIVTLYRKNTIRDLDLILKNQIRDLGR